MAPHSCLENPMDGGAWWTAVHGVTKSWTRLSDFTFSFHFHALEKEMAAHSSILALRIPGTGQPGGLPSTGSHSRTRLKWLSSSSNKEIILDLPMGPVQSLKSKRIRGGQKKGRSHEAEGVIREMWSLERTWWSLLAFRWWVTTRQGTRSTSRSWQQPHVSSQPENRGLLLVSLELNAANHPKEPGSTFCPRASW